MVATEHVDDVDTSGGRPLGFDPAEAISEAMTAFWEHGVVKTTTQVLEQSTGLSRSSLRNTFGPKHVLLLAGLDHYLALVADVLVAPMIEGDAGLSDITDFLHDLAARKLEPPASHGCLVVNVAAETDALPDDVRERVERYRELLRDGFMTVLARAADLGEADPGEIEARADVLLGCAVAINWTARAAGANAAVQLAESTARVVEGWRRESDGS